MNTAPDTPVLSRASSHSSKGRRSPPLSLDFSDLPPLIQPSPPSNTLLVTNLKDPAIFAAPTLAHLRDLITTHSPDPVYAFSPLKSLHRIIITFTTVEAATVIRQVLDGETLFGYRVRVYFGESTPITSEQDRHLQAPKLGKQFFISPPPSPPHGWQSKEEDPPNKEVHAEDLAVALEKLSAGRDTSAMDSAGPSPISPKGARFRSSSTTILYQPEEYGLSPDFPAIAVEDLTMTPGDWDDAEEETLPVKQPLLHTSRPPVELM